jgi:hypothetical protein
MKQRAASGFLVRSVVVDVIVGSVCHGTPQSLDTRNALLRLILRLILAEARRMLAKMTRRRRWRAFAS